MRRPSASGGCVLAASSARRLALSSGLGSPSDRPRRLAPSGLLGKRGRHLGACSRFLICPSVSSRWWQSSNDIRGQPRLGRMSVGDLRAVAVVGAVVVVAAASSNLRAGAGSAQPRGKIAFVRYSLRIGHPHVYVLALGKRTPRPLPLPGIATQAPTWSPSGRRLAFIAGRNAPNSRDITGKADLYVANGDGRRVRRLTQHSARVGSPAWSPDERRLVFVQTFASGKRASLWIVGADGGASRRITQSGIDIEPSWAPDGGTIAFLRIDPKTYRGAIWSVRPDGSGAHRILPGLHNAGEPVWSPDSRALLVQDNRAIYSVRPDGTGRRTIVRLARNARGAVEDPQPSWSPDAHWIAFCQLRNEAVEASNIWIVRADGTGLRRVTHSSEFDTDPSWAP